MSIPTPRSQVPSEVHPNRISFLDGFLCRPALVALLVAAVAITSIVLLRSVDRTAFLSYGDSTSHLVQARQFVDSQRTGLANIGTGWLPLPHLLLLPFAAVDALFHEGTAPAFLGVPLLAGAALLLGLLTERLSGSRIAGGVAAAVIGFNPSIVYLAGTPMSEPVLLFFVAAAAWAYGEWWTGVGGTRWLVLASACAMMATLTRYEAWLLPPVMAVGVLVRLRFEGTGARAGILRPLAGLGLAFAGIAAWMGWNVVRAGTPLYFLHDTYNAGSPSARAALAGHPELVASLLGSAMWRVYGPVVLVVALGGVVLAMRRSWMLLALLVAPMAFTAAALLLGYVQMDAWGWNVRYVVALAPFLAVAGGVLAGAVARRSGIAAVVVGAALLGVYALQAFSPAQSIPTYREASRQVDRMTVWAADMGKEVGACYKEGNVALFIGHGQAHRMLISTGLPLRVFSFLLDDDTTHLRTMPYRTCPLLVRAVFAPPGQADDINALVRAPAMLEEHYREIYRNPEFVLYARR